MNDRAFAIGLAFRLGFLSVCKNLAEDEKRWITIHPHGKFDANGEKIKGQPILIDDDKGVVLGGAGGVLNGKKLKKKNPAKKAVPKKETKKETKAKKSAKPKKEMEKQAKTPSPIEKAFGAKDYETYRKSISNGDPLALSVFNKMEKHISIATIYGDKCYVDYDTMQIFLLSPLVPITSNGSDGETMSHETGHFIDRFADGGHISCTYKDGMLGSAIRKDVKAYVDAKLTQMREDYTKLPMLDYLKKYNTAISMTNYRDTPRRKCAYAEVRAELDRLPLDKVNGLATSAIMDIFEGATRGKILCTYGHTISYWKENPKRSPCECFAELFSILLHHPETMKNVEKYLPNTVSAFNEVLKETDARL